jgi:hypothetical protein
MFSVEPHRYISMIISSWFLLAMPAVFAVGILPRILIAPTLVYMGWLTYVCIDCAYRTERFSRFADFRMLTNLGFAPAFASLAILIACCKQLMFGPFESILLSCMPVLLAFFIYLIFYMSRTSSDLLTVRSGHVDVAEVSQPNRWVHGAIGSCLGGLLYPLVRAYQSPATLLALLFVVISLFMLFYHRVSISALRTLKEQEFRESKEFSFKDIDDIRLRRSASWIGRLFAKRAIR